MSTPDMASTFLFLVYFFRLTVISEHIFGHLPINYQLDFINIVNIYNTYSNKIKSLKITTYTLTLVLLNKLRCHAHF